MSGLEAQYRAALKWYPSRWRRAHEEVVVGTLLDAAEDENRVRARITEVASLIVHGAARRVAMAPSAVPKSIRDRMSIGALAIGTAIAVTGVPLLELNQGRSAAWFGGEVATFGPFASPAILAYALWPVALVLALIGRPTAARVTVAATIPVLVAARLVGDAFEMWGRPAWAYLSILILLAVIAVLGTPRLERRGRLWLTGWFVAALLFFALPPMLNSRGDWSQQPSWLNQPGWVHWTPLIAVLISLVLLVARQPAWAVAVLPLCLPFVFATMFDGRADNSLPLWVLVIALAPVVAVGVVRALGYRVRVTRNPPEISPRR